eukprot:scaffold101680_cov48-Attheya_sp.AAC.1
MPKALSPPKSINTAQTNVKQQNLEGTLISGHLFLKRGHRDSSVFAQADVPDHSGGIGIKMPIHTFLPQIW